MKLEEVPSTAQPFITVANHNYDQKATPERTFSFAAFYQFRQKHYERSIIQAYSLEVFFSLFFYDKSYELPKCARWAVIAALIRLCVCFLYSEKGVQVLNKYKW